jgi:BirA family biotin operon repressor/biotin-[acetyl-CoA-carboxylase] ligase
MPISDLEGLPSLLKTLVFGKAGFSLLASATSTNALALQAAAQGAPGGTVIIADEQTAGRGRGGHAWHSEPGSGIYLSIVLRPELPPSAVLWLSLLTGVAARTAIHAVSGLMIDLRWPNDLMLNVEGRDRKCGGILLESSSRGAREAVEYVVIGIGLNVNHAQFPPALTKQATSLRLATGREFDRAEVTAEFLLQLELDYAAFVIDPEAEIKQLRRRFEEGSSYARGARVEVHDSGVANYSGVTQGLDSRGALLVETDNGLLTVISGGVRKI